MLKELNIENYALIDKLNIDFSGGMSIITGETGAGKSILLGALSLVLGNRADTSVLKNREQNCVVETTFDIEGYNLESFFEQNEIDYDSELIIRRTINPVGKSRSFINDNPVNASILKELGNKLFDIHSQHQNLLLSTNSFQLSILDAAANLSNVKENYTKNYRLYKDEKKKLDELLEQKDRAKADYDYVSFQFEQLHKADLKPNEQEELEEEIQTLSNIDDIKTGYMRLISLLSDDRSVVDMLKESEAVLNKLAKVHTPSENLAGRVGETLIEIRDIAREAEKLNESFDIDPEKLRAMEERLNTIYDLQQKHKVNSIEELLVLQNQFEKTLNEIDNFDENIIKIQKNVDEYYSKVKELGSQISKQRNKSVAEIEKHVTELLKTQGMPNAVFCVEISQLPEYTKDGIDNVVFLFSANKDMLPKEISKVASGGEMSRLMLSLKSLLVKGMRLPTIIFDEIDAGISGEVADKMGDIIKELSGKTQVINITHLPQVAAKGDFHYLVYKEDTPTATYTKVRKLDYNDRVAEIAKMLSGSKVTDNAMEHARDLINYQLPINNYEKKNS